MSDAAPQVYLRPSARDLRDIPLDTDTAMRARLTLKPRELGVWFNLRTHLWLFGDLPVAIRAMAAIAGVGAKSLEKMMPVLAPLFDRDSHGRWRDLDLEDERDARLELAPADRRESIERRDTTREIAADGRRVDPALSETRRRAGQEGGRKRWEERRRRLQLIDGGRGDDVSDMANQDNERAAAGMANDRDPIANGMANVVDLPAGFAAALPSVATLSASSGQSQLASLSNSNSKSEDQTDKLTSKPAARAEADAPAPIAKPMAKPAEPSTGGGVAKPGPSDAVIIDAVIRSCNGLVTKAHVHRRLPALRSVLEQGADFFLDVVPQIQAFARGKREIANCANQPILKEALAHYHSRVATQSLPVSSGPLEMIFVVKGSPQERAWLDHYRKKSFPTTERVVDDRPTLGWPFVSEWPPGCDPAVYLAPAAPG